MKLLENNAREGTATSGTMATCDDVIMTSYLGKFSNLHSIKNFYKSF